MPVFILCYFNEEVLLKLFVFFWVCHMIVVPKSWTLVRGDKKAEPSCALKDLPQTSSTQKKKYSLTDLESEAVG